MGNLITLHEQKLDGRVRQKLQMWSWIMLRPILRKLVVVPQIMQVMIILMGSKHGVAWKCLQAWWCSKHDDNLKYGSLVAAANRHSNGRVKSTQSGAYSSEVRNRTFKICSWCWDQISERICLEHGVAWKCLRACRTRDIWTQSKTSWTIDETRDVTPQFFFFSYYYYYLFFN